MGAMFLICGPAWVRTPGCGPQILLREAPRGCKWGEIGREIGSVISVGANDYQPSTTTTDSLKDSKPIRNEFVYTRHS